MTLRSQFLISDAPCIHDTLKRVHEDRKVVTQKHLYLRFSTAPPSFRATGPPVRGIMAVRLGKAVKESLLLGA